MERSKAMRLGAERRIMGAEQSGAFGSGVKDNETGWSIAERSGAFGSGAEDNETELSVWKWSGG